MLPQALRHVRLSALEDEGREATKIATHRSGLRGQYARTRQVQLEEEVATAKQGLRVKPEDDELLEAAPRAQSLVDKLFDVRECGGRLCVLRPG